MKQEILPSTFKSIPQGVYVGFWNRVAARLIDFVVVLPFLGLSYYIQSLGLDAYKWSLIPQLFLTLAYEVVLVKVYGGTPGKLAMGMKVIQINGDEVDWKNAFLRYSVELLIAVIGVYAMYLTLNMADAGTFNSLGLLKRSAYLSMLNPVTMKFSSYLSLAWTFAGVIVLVVNVRKRSTHDFVAGTVVVKSVYLEQMREEINAEEGDGVDGK